MKVAQHFLNQGKKKVSYKDYAGAITYFDKGIEINPEFALAYLNRGIAKNFNQDQEGAFNFNKSLDFESVESNTNFGQGFKAESSTQYAATVIADFDKAIGINPWFAKAYYSRGRVKSGFNNHTRVSVPNLGDKKFGYPKSNFKKTHINEIRQDDYAGVMADFDKAIEIDPEFAEAYYSRGLAKNYRSNFPDSNNDLSKVQEIDLNFAGALIIQALAIDNQIKDYAGAIADFDKAIEINPEFADAYYCRGLVKNYFRNQVSELVNPVQTIEFDGRFATGKFDEDFAANYPSKDFVGIIADFDMAIQINPKHAKAYCSRGVLKIFAQDLCQEIILILKNKPIDTVKREAFQGGKSIGDVMFNKYAGAITDFDKAIEINPRFANAYFLRGILKTYCQDHKGAAIDFEKSIELDPEFSEVYNKSGLSTRVTKQLSHTFLN